MKSIAEMTDLVRANPARYAGWMLVLVVLCAAAFTIGDTLGMEYDMYTH